MDPNIADKLYNTYYMKVYSFVLTLARDHTLAEEITQETFYRAMSADKNSFKGESGEYTWLCAIAKNLFFDESRRRTKHQEFPTEIDSGVDIEKSAADKDQAFRIHMVLHDLEEPYREVFELRVFGELSFAQIGKIFRKTENWARVTFHRAKLKIQERMDTDNE